MPNHPQSGVQGYDAANFTEWLPIVSHKFLSPDIGMLNQRAPAGAHGTNETIVPELTNTAVLFFRRGSPMLDAGVGSVIHRPLAAGSYAVVPKGVASWWHATPHNVNEVFHIHYSDAAMSQHDADLDLASDPLGCGAHEGNEFLVQLIERIMRHLDAGYGASSLFLDSAATVVFHELARLRHGWPRPGQARGGLAGWQVRRVTEFLEAHLDQNITLNDMAAIARLSSFHFARCFKTSLGESPHRYQMRRRVDRAKNLLAHSDLGITEIALAVGYDSPQALSRVFRNLVGTTPSHFRRQTRF